MPPKVALTKSEAIDRITDIEHLRRVAHRMWEAFFASHSQTAHAIGVLLENACKDCADYIFEGGEPCPRWSEWQRKVTDGFGSV